MFLISEIEENNQRLIKGTEFEKFFKKDSQSCTIIQNPSGDVSKTVQSLNVQEKAFLFNIFNRLLLSITERYQSLGLSAGKGNGIVKALIRYNLCKIISINLGGRGGLTKFLEITEQGYKVINMPPLKYTKGTGFEHWFWQNKIAENLRKLEVGKVLIEICLNSKFIDILVEQLKDDKQIKIAIEISITSTPEDEKNNIIKDLESGADFVICACQKEKKDRINEMIASLDSKYKDKTKLLLLPQLLKIHSYEELVEILKQRSIYEKNKNP